MNRDRVPSALLLISLLGAAVTLGACGKDEPKKEPAAAAPAVSASAAAETPKAPEGTVFAKATPKVGDKHDESDDVHMKIEMTVDTGNGKPQANAIVVDGKQKRTEEVLAVTGDAPTKLKVTWAEKTDTVSDGDPAKAKPKKSPLAGKTYVLDTAGGKLAVTDEKGKPAPSAEMKLIEKQYKLLGKPDPIQAAMPATPLRPGDPVPALAKAIEEEMGARAEGMNAANATVVFKELNGDDAIFDVGLTLSKEEGPMKLAIDMKGPVTVSKSTSQTKAIALKGPISVSARPEAKSKAKMDGKGEMEMHFSVDGAPAK